jgi:DNA-binding CsgD family transcriptional regulator
MGDNYMSEIDLAVEMQATAPSYAKFIRTVATDFNIATRLLNLLKPLRLQMGIGRVSIIRLFWESMESEIIAECVTPGLIQRSGRIDCSHMKPWGTIHEREGGRELIDKLDLNPGGIQILVDDFQELVKNPCCQVLSWTWPEDKSMAITPVGIFGMVPEWQASLVCTHHEAHEWLQSEREAMLNVAIEASKILTQDFSIKQLNNTLNSVEKNNLERDHRLVGILPKDISFTPAEKRLLSALMNTEDTRNKFLASKLNVSGKTIEAHLTSLFAKTGLKNRTLLARWVALHSSQLG